MEEAKAQIQRLSGVFKNDGLKDALLKARQELRDAEAAHRTRMEVIEDSIGQVRRKNKQVELEVERLQMHQDKNASSFNRKNSERIKLSRRIIELEQENEEIEARVCELTEKIGRLEMEVRMLGHPTIDELYYEIVKGFGVEFVETGGVTSAKIVSRSKSDVFVVECDESKGKQEICERIWECIEF